MVCYLQAVGLRAALVSLLVVGPLLACLPGCSEADRPPPLDFTEPSTDASAPDVRLDVTQCEGPPGPDAEGGCGNEVFPVPRKRPNLYFVVDASGSMDEQIEGGVRTKLSSAKVAIADLLREIGHLVNYGVALYPEGGGDGCGAGAEVFPTAPGDPLVCRAQGQDGPRLTMLTQLMGRWGASGGTPLTDTLLAISPTLKALPPPTAVVLLTDGAPNCWQDAMCPADHCEFTLEGVSYEDKLCDASFNCCDPEKTVPGAQLSCIDDGRAEAAVKLLSEAGISTYVVGMPGSEVFSDILDGLAEAGGTARSALPAYYSVSDTASLSAALAQIGAEVALGCEIALQEEPEHPELVNLYFDRGLLVFGAEDGWSWKDPQTVLLSPDACAKLRSGTVGNVHVVSGCPTVIR